MSYVTLTCFMQHGTTSQRCHKGSRWQDEQQVCHFVFDDFPKKGLKYWNKKNNGYIISILNCIFKEFIIV